MRSETMPQNRRLGGCGSAESTRPRAHASAPERTLPSLPKAAPSGFPQALPQGEVLPRLRRSIRKPCRRRFAGSPTSTAASPLSPKSRHCWGTGFLNDNSPGASSGFQRSRGAAAALSRGRKPMESSTTTGGSYKSETGFVSGKVSPAPAPTTTVRITQRKNSRSSMKTNHQWTRIVTKTDGPPSTTSGTNMLLSLLSRWCDPVMGGSPPGSAGVPPAQILPQLRPSPPPESTGSGALPLLRPGPCGSRRQGGRLQHRRETERQPKGQHAGGTPALPGVSSRW